MRAAAHSLGQIRSRSSVTVLIAALENETNPSDVRREAATALGLIGDASAASALRAALASADPYLSEAAREAVEAHGAELQRAWQPLFEQALGDAASDPLLVNYAFSVLRGFLQGNLIATSIGAQASSRRQRALVVRGVACAIREQAAEKGLAVD